MAPGMSSGGALEPGPSGIRLGGGVNPDQALLWNAGTCRSDVKGEAQAGDPREGKSTDAGHRDGAVRSRDEGSVMELDRRGCGIPPRTGGQPVMGGAPWPRQSCWTTKPTAGYWEPDEPRGSRPVLRERGGETPPRHSPLWIGCNRCIAAPGFRWPPTRCPRSGLLPSRHHVRFSIGGSTLIRRVLENVPHGLAGPNLLSSRGQLASFLQPTTYFR